MIDKFSKERFEAELPEAKAEFVSGEWQYSIPVGSFAQIKVRSTVDGSGFAAESGEDSIRMWVEVRGDDGTFRSFSKLKDALGAYTTRVPGWEKRVADKLATLREVAERFKRPVSHCDKCKDWKNPAISNSSRNPGRPYEKCWRCQDGFQWLDEPAEVGQLEDTPRLATQNKSILDGGEESGDLFASIEKMLMSDSVVVKKSTVTLNEQQQAIVESPPNSAWRAIAGPGSGKTATMEHRINTLVAHGALPGEILYMVFNKTMADEGAERIGARLMANGVPPTDVAQYQQWFCTIHAACFRMLRDWYAGNNKRCPDVAKDWMIRKSLDDIIPDLWKTTSENVPTASEVYSWICTAKHHNLAMGEDEQWYIERLMGMYDEQMATYHGERLATAREQFDREMRGDNKLTFPDMLFGVEQLLTTDQQFREKWQNQFKWVLVDEAQDTNRQAMRIAMILAKPQNNFCIVGDQDQMMYRFTGAAPEANLYGFADEFPDGALFFLETNYRSPKSIVSACNRLIRYNYEDHGGPYPQMYLKTLRPREGAEEGNPVSFTWHLTPEDEARELALDIKHRMDRGEHPSRFFVGSRTRAQLGYLEPMLTMLKVPFVNITGGSFWQLRHIRQCVGYLRLAEDRSDKQAFSDIYNAASSKMVNPWGKNEGDYSSTRWLGKAFLSWCRGDLSQIEEKGLGFYVDGRSCSRGFAPGLEDLFYTMNEIESFDKMSDAIDWMKKNVFEQIFRHELDEEDMALTKLDDLDTVRGVASGFETVREFLDYIDAAIQAAEDARNKNWDEYVVLSTIHRLKGLQRPVVYGVGWCQGENEKTGMPVGLLPHTFSLTDPPRQGPLDLSHRNSVEDERCIAFVLISRAQEECHLSGCAEWRGATMRPSDFLYEAGIL